MMMIIGLLTVSIVSVFQGHSFYNVFVSAAFYFEIFNFFLITYSKSKDIGLCCRNTNDYNDDDSGTVIVITIIIILIIFRSLFS